MDISGIIDKVDALKNPDESFFSSDNQDKQDYLNMFKDALAVEFGGITHDGFLVLDAPLATAPYPEQLTRLEQMYEVLNEKLKEIE